jgi:hypothetical protein
VGHLGTESSTKGPATSTLANTCPSTHPHSRKGAGTKGRSTSSKIVCPHGPNLQQYHNHINLLEILTLLGKWIIDLPSIPQYCLPTGVPIICWQSVLGKCFRGQRCKYAQGHVEKADAMDSFADAVSDVISKGVVYYTNLPARGSSPRGKCKTAESCLESWLWTGAHQDAVGTEHITVALPVHFQSKKLVNSIFIPTDKCPNAQKGSTLVGHKTLRTGTPSKQFPFTSNFIPK